MASERWWVIKAAPERTGIQQITYIQASSRQQALETLPGSTYVGGPFATEAAAQKAFPEGSSGTRPEPPGLPAPKLSDKPQNPLGGLASIGQFFDRLAEANTWIRVGEVVLGLILLGVGVARITGAQNVVSQVVKARIP